MNLDQLALKYKTDKASNHHNYCGYYENHFAPLKNQPVILLELGYGGYNYIDRGGESAKMWCEYFTNSHARIISTDLYEKHHRIVDARFRFYQGSQDDADFLQGVIHINGQPDIIIDDASHNAKKTVKSFEILFPLLKQGGWYVIEDIEGSYWDEWSEGTKDYTDFYYRHPVNLGRQLINDVNAKYIPHFKADYPISEIHFYQNIIFIKKL